MMTTVLWIALALVWGIILTIWQGMRWQKQRRHALAQARLSELMYDVDKARARMLHIRLMQPTTSRFTRRSKEGGAS